MPQRIKTKDGRIFEDGHRVRDKAARSAPPSPAASMPAKLSPASDHRIAQHNRTVGCEVAAWIKDNLDEVQASLVAVNRKIRAVDVENNSVTLASIRFHMRQLVALSQRLGR